MSRGGPGDGSPGPLARYLAPPGSAATPASAGEHHFEPVGTVQAVAAGLAALHAEPVPAGLRRVTFAGELERARARVAAGEVAPASLPEAYRRIDPPRLVELCARAAPPEAPPVPTHGHPTVDDVLLEHGRFAGFAHLEHLAAADPYRDVAVAAASLVATVGPAALAPFFAAYGAGPEPARLDAWVLLTHLLW